MSLITIHLDIKFGRCNVDKIQGLGLNSKEKILTCININVPLRKQVYWNNLEQTLDDVLYYSSHEGLIICGNFSARIGPSLEILNLKAIFLK